MRAPWLAWSCARVFERVKVCEVNFPGKVRLSSLPFREAEQSRKTLTRETKETINPPVGEIWTLHDVGKSREHQRAWRGGREDPFIVSGELQPLRVGSANQKVGLTGGSSGFMALCL